MNATRDVDMPMLSV